MLSSIKARLAEHRQDEGGFTLIELMVVVLIIAILIAIAIPTFLGARKSAQDRAAQADLRNALTALRVGYNDTQDYQAAGAELASIEPSLTYNSAGGSSGPSNIAWSTTGPAPVTSAGLAALAADGTCWQLYDTATAGTSFGSTPNATAATCTPPTAVITTGPHPTNW
jgi:type IV pilus assembly protein PilA